jgi:hypothetical protein
MEKETYKALDGILECLKEANAEKYKSNTDTSTAEFKSVIQITFWLTANKIKFKQEDIYLMLSYLCHEENFITHEKHFVDSALYSHYAILLKGKIFIDNGGYIGQIKSENDGNIRMETLEKNQKISRRMMNWLTFFVAIGTLVAAWYYLEMLNKDVYHWWH